MTIEDMNDQLARIDAELDRSYQAAGGTPTIYLKAIYQLIAFYVKLRCGLFGGTGAPPQNVATDRPRRHERAAK